MVYPLGTGLLESPRDARNIQWRSKPSCFATVWRVGLRKCHTQTPPSCPGGGNPRGTLSRGEGGGRRVRGQGVLGAGSTVTWCVKHFDSQLGGSQRHLQESGHISDIRQPDK